MPAATYPETLPRARRRAQGAYYTPGWLVDEVVAEALAGPLARARFCDGAPELRVLDPACGDGRFLVACVERMVAAGADRAAAVRRCVVGIERDPDAAARARAALGPGADVRVAEALLSGAAAPGSWDVVVGNPPWLRSVALKAEDPALWLRLRGAYAATSYKEWDLYAAFIEQALVWAAPGGAIGLVTPSRWLTAAFAERLRAHVAPSVRRIVDLGARQVFAGATTYTALVFLERGVARDLVEVVRDGAAPLDPRRHARRGAVGARPRPADRAPAHRRAAARRPRAHRQGRRDQRRSGVPARAARRRALVARARGAR
jgi:methylase of polypeptide subunit release factors